MSNAKQKLTELTKQYDEAYKEFDAAELALSKLLINRSIVFKTPEYKAVKAAKNKTQLLSDAITKLKKESRL